MRKKTINKTFATTLLAIALCGFTLTGCGSSDTTNSADTTSEVTAEVATEEDAAEAATSDSVETTSSDLQTDETLTEETTATEDVSDTDTDDKTSVDTDEESSDADALATSDESEEALPEFTVDKWKEPKTYYSSIALNVRKGPSTDYDVVGSLKSGQEVSVLGQASTGWYVITYKDEECFASEKYLSENPPVIETADPVPNPETTPAPGGEVPAPAPAPTPVAAPAGIIFVGDSRFVGMHEAVGDNGITWICEPAKGYDWFCESAVGRIDNHVGKGTKILINLGVNDTRNANNYVATINAKAAEWAARGAKVYYASVNPVWDNPYVTEEQVVNFNNCVAGGLSGVRYINSHDYLISIGYNAVDGLHYDANTYTNIYNYLLSNM